MWFSIELFLWWKNILRVGGCTSRPFQPYTQYFIVCKRMWIASAEEMLLSACVLWCHCCCGILYIYVNGSCYICEYYAMQAQWGESLSAAFIATAEQMEMRWPIDLPYISESDVCLVVLWKWRAEGRHKRQENRDFLSFLPRLSGFFKFNEETRRCWYTIDECCCETDWAQKRAKNDQGYFPNAIKWMTRANARGKYKNEKASIALSFNEPIHIDARGKIKKWRDI